MSDTLLRQYLIEPGVYRLGQYSPISIRDQMVRAHYLIELLSAQGKLTRTTRLAIVGAGAAGIALAGYACRCGIAKVVLVESETFPMPLQAKCISRHLDPVQYDWPAAHWRARTWPLPESAVPRRFTATGHGPPVALSRARAREYAQQFQNFVYAIPSIAGFELLVNYEAAPWTRNIDDSIHIPLHLTGAQLPPHPLDVDLAIFATGIGSEISRLPEAATSSTSMFEGIPFWHEDHFEDPAFGLHWKQLQNGILVSGSGDGALQDFIRLATGVQTVGQVLEHVLDPLPRDSAWKDRLNGLWHWEDHATRAGLMLSGKAFECTNLRRLHQQHLAVVQDIKASPEWATVVGTLNRMINGRPVKKLALAFPCNHFSGTYPLNRFVTLLLAEYMTECLSYNPLRPGRMAMETTHVHNNGCGSACWGELHKVHFAKQVTCLTTELEAKQQLQSSDLNVSEWQEFEGLVIRHGIHPEWLTGSAPRLIPQHVPFHLP